MTRTPAQAKHIDTLNRLPELVRILRTYPSTTVVIKTRPVFCAVCYVDFEVFSSCKLLVTCKNNLCYISMFLLNDSVEHPI